MTDCNCNCNKNVQQVTGCVCDASQVITGTLSIPTFREKEQVEKVITPTQAEQVLAPEAGTEFSKVTVKPIPSNYGRISFDGIAIRVE